MTTEKQPVSNAKIISFFASEVAANPDLYFECGELNSTRLAESTQDHFGVMTDEGKTDVEELIFDLAVTFSNK
jgi:hypothetical protein